MDTTPDLPGAPKPGPATIAGLVAESAELRKTIVGLRADLAASEKRNAEALRAEKSKRRKSFRWVLVAVVVDVAFTITLATVLSGQASTNAQLKAATAQIQESLRQNYLTAQQQQATRVDLLCPLYSALLSVAEYPPAAPLPAAQLKVRNDAITALKAGYTKAGC